MQFTINLATRRYLNLRGLNIVLAVCFLLLGALLLLQVKDVAGNQAELSRLRKQLSGASAGSAGPTVSEAQMKQLSAKIHFANTLIDQKSMNWLGLLDALEEVVPPGVALTQIMPLKDGVTVSGVARSFPELQGLLENMERSRNFSDVYLLSQSQQKVGLTQQGISFSLSCRVSYR